jgi:hypothetical protein
LPFFKPTHEDTHLETLFSGTDKEKLQYMLRRIYTMQRRCMQREALLLATPLLQA